MARKYASTSRAPTLPRNTASGGKVTIRHTEPRGGGSSVCGRCSVSRMPFMRAGVASVTQMRVEAKPGRAGSVRTSGDGPSAMASDLPSALSMQTIRRTGFTPSMSSSYSSNFAPIMTKAMVTSLRSLDHRCQLPSCTTTSPGFITSVPVSSTSTRSPASMIP